MLQAIQEPKVSEDGFAAYSKKANDITGNSFRSERAWCNCACVRFLSLMPSAHREHWIAVRMSTKRLEKLVKMRRGNASLQSVGKLCLFCVAVAVMRFVTWFFLFCFLPTDHWEMLARGEMWVKLRESHGQWDLQADKTKTPQNSIWFSETSLVNPQRISLVG